MQRLRSLSCRTIWNLLHLNVDILWKWLAAASLGFALLLPLLCPGPVFLFLPILPALLLFLLTDGIPGVRFTSIVLTIQKRE